MDFVSLAGISAGLAMDAFAVCVAGGAARGRGNPLFPFALKLAASFGLFQGLMPMAGWLVGKAGESLIASVDHWIALLLLSYLGAEMIREGWKKQKDGGKPQAGFSDLKLRTLAALSVATSIDALAAGILLPSAVGAGTLPLMLVSAGSISLVAFFLSLAGVFLGNSFGKLLSGKAELAGGAVLMGIGVKIFLDHMFF